jgi:hypothetical protein
MVTPFNSKNFYGEYADILSVPSDIVLSRDQILSLPEREYHNGMKEHRGTHEGRHQFKKLNVELKEWLKQNFPFEIFAYYSVYPILLQPHVDIRPIAYNYLIDTGGDIDTVFYNKVPNVGATKLWNSINPRNVKYDNLNEDEPLKEISRIRFDSHRWVKLQTDIPHGTEGIMTGPRVFITVTQTIDMPVDNSPISQSLRDMITDW